MADFGISEALLGLSTAATAAGTLAAGAAADSSGKFKAQQDLMAAQESRASSQRQSIEKRRDADLTISKLRAQAGAGATTDPGIEKLGEEISARGEYQALMETYKGENRARGLQDDAAASIMEGKSKKNASYLSAAGTLASGGTSMYRAYNKIPYYG
jgi:hypothetical protein